MFNDSFLLTKVHGIPDINFRKIKNVEQPCRSVNITKINPKQKEIMGDFMKKHNDLAKNIVKNTAEGRGTSKRLWERLTEELNNAGPPLKTEKSWRKVWADQKHKVKKNLSRNKKSLKKTGGGPYDIVSLSAFEECVAASTGLEKSIQGLNVPRYGASEILHADMENNIANSQLFFGSDCNSSGSDDSVIQRISPPIATTSTDDNEIQPIAPPSPPIATTSSGKRRKTKSKTKSRTERIELLEKFYEEQSNFQNAVLGKMDELISVKKQKLELAKQTAAQNKKYQEDCLIAKIRKIQALEDAADIKLMELEK